MTSITSSTHLKGFEDEYSLELFNEYFGIDSDVESDHAAAEIGFINALSLAKGRFDSVYGVSRMPNEDSDVQEMSKSFQLLGRVFSRPIRSSRSQNITFVSSSRLTDGTQVSCRHGIPLLAPHADFNTTIQPVSMKLRQQQS